MMYFKLSFYFVVISIFNIMQISICLDDENELCVVKTPLQIPYLSPYVIKPSICPGCMNNQIFVLNGTKPKFNGVHIFEVDYPIDGKIGLVFTMDETYSDEGTKRNFVTSLTYAIVLSSTESRPITFIVSTDIKSILNIRFIFVLTGKNILKTVDIPFYTQIEKSSWFALNSLSKSLEEFGFISSITKANDANYINFNLSSLIESNSVGVLCPDDFSQGYINRDLNQQSPLAICDSVLPITMAGCYHDNLAGNTFNDVHILEIFGSGTNSSLLLSIRGVDRNLMESNLFGRHKQILSKSSFKKSDSDVNRNLTLVLHNSSPTTWKLKVENLKGTIKLILGDGDTYDSSINFMSDEVVVRSEYKQFSKEFDKMIVDVLLSVGQPVSYTKSSHPDVFEILVPQKLNIKSTSTEIIHGNKFEAQRLTSSEASSLVDKSVSYSCTRDHVSVSIPIEISNRVGGIDMMMNEPKCRGTSNGTHIVLISLYSVCGFELEISGGNYIYKNIVYLLVQRYHSFSGFADDEDFEGSGYGNDFSYGSNIPTKIILCKHEPPEKNILSSIRRRIDYKMDVFNDVDLNSLMIRNVGSTHVTNTGLIYTKVSLPDEYRGKLQLHLEECWLGDDPLANYGTKNVILIRKSCKFQPYVNVQIDEFHSQVIFGFNLRETSEADRPTYVHCTMGVCSSDALPIADINKCGHPETYCNNTALMDAYQHQATASRISTTIKGPIAFRLNPNEDELHSNVAKGNYDGTNNKMNLLDGESSIDLNEEEEEETVIVDGISMEIVVGIAIASFVTGAGLTAVLWIIYVQTDPHRQKRSEVQVPKGVRYDISAQSGSSTPSSQAPIAQEP